MFYMGPGVGPLLVNEVVYFLTKFSAFFLILPQQAEYNTARTKMKEKIWSNTDILVERL